MEMGIARQRKEQERKLEEIKTDAKKSGENNSIQQKNNNNEQNAGW